MWRNVVTYEKYINKHANGTMGTNVLILECGHTKAQKGSVKIPNRAFCTTCDDLCKGHRPWNQVGNIRETWDPVTQTLVRTETQPPEETR
jgi:hypothetical protein